MIGLRALAATTWESLQELKHPYYIINILLSLSYPICKIVAPICALVFDGECAFEGRETEILFFMLLIVMARARKTGSMSMVAYLTNSFMYCKVANCALWFFAFKPYGLFFLVLFLLQGLLLPQPTYKGPQKVTYFRDGQTFKDEIARDKKNTWLIEFYTAWNPSCVNFAPLFAELSAKYALENFKFGKIDLGRYPEIGEEFGISDSAFSKQLPTLILFKEGKAIMYRPFVDSAGKLIKFHFNKDNIINVFDLNNVHIECKKATEEKNKNKKTAGKTANSHLKAE